MNIERGQSVSLLLSIFLAFAHVSLGACAGGESERVQHSGVQPEVMRGAGVSALGWSASERKLLASLSLARLPSPKADWRNPLAGNAIAIKFGERLFNDVRLSGDNRFACATCHQADRAFQDGLPLAAGRRTLTRNTPSLLGVSANNWWYWDGRKDSLWSQALEPLEARHEMRGSRGAIVDLIRTDPDYSSLYSQVFGPLPTLPDVERRHRQALPEPLQWSVDLVFSQIGRAIAAYETTLQHTPSEFDCYVDAVLSESSPACDFTAAAERGLRLFISGAANCVSCHSGPLFSDRSFRNVGTAALSEGRLAGVQRLLADPFNCAAIESLEGVDCGHLRRAGAVEVQRLQAGALRTPSLRNIANTAPYMHDGRFATLAEVVEHYREPPLGAIHELAPIGGLSATAATDLVEFLESLSGK